MMFFYQVLEEPYQIKTMENMTVQSLQFRVYRSVSAFCPDPDLDSGKKADPDPDQKDPDLKH